VGRAQRLRPFGPPRHFVATFGAQGRFLRFRPESQTMSVAFRREGDDEHKEPEFELPIAVGPNLVTPRGLRLLGEAVERIEAEIAATGDEEARKKLQRRLRYFHTRQSTADVQEPPADASVGIGSRVTYRLNKADKTITIVGGDEADPALGCVAFSAPLARALMGAEAGESVEYQGREDAIALLAVETDPETQL
jgi:transcription elongation GreA/GreB family factor